MHVRFIESAKLGLLVVAHVVEIVTIVLVKLRYWQLKIVLGVSDQLLLLWNNSMTKRKTNGRQIQIKKRLCTIMMISLLLEAVEVMMGA